PIPCAAEDKAAPGRQNRAGLRRTRAVGPRRRLVGELDRIDAADFAVAAGDGYAGINRATAARIGLSGIKRSRRRVRAVFIERQIQDAGLRAVGRRRPAAAAWIGWAIHGR